MSGQPDFDNDYVPVAQRIRIFREKYPEGSLRPLDPSHPFRLVAVDNKNYIAVTAAAFRHPEDPAPGVGQAWQVVPGTDEYALHSELMVAETSAWGRAIVAALAADASKVASAEEVKAAVANRAQQPRQAAQQAPQAPQQPQAPDAPVAHTSTPEAAPQSTPAGDEEANRALVAEAMRLIEDPATDSASLRDVWQVLNQARLLAWRVPASQGMDPDGDGQVPLGSLVAFVGRARKEQQSA